MASFNGSSAPPPQDQLDLANLASSIAECFTTGASSELPASKNVTFGSKTPISSQSRLERTLSLQPPQLKRASSLTGEHVPSLTVPQSSEYIPASGETTPREYVPSLTVSQSSEYIPASGETTPREYVPSLTVPPLSVYIPGSGETTPRPSRDDIIASRLVMPDRSLSHQRDPDTPITPTTPCPGTSANEQPSGYDEFFTRASAVESTSTSDDSHTL